MTLIWIWTPTKETAARLMERMGEEGSIDDYLRMDENEASSDFYV